MANKNTSKYKMLSVIVPTYNERNTVGEVVRRMRTVELPADLDFEIVVVDDGSTDGTDKVLATLEDSTVHVVKHQNNQGKGAAIRTGLGVARGDLLLIEDADLEYRPEDWGRLLDPVLNGNAKVVFGTRFHSAREAAPLTQVLAKRALSVAACLLYNTTLTDVGTGIEVIDRELFESLNVQADDFAFQPELTAKLLRRRERIFEVPVNYAIRHEGRKFHSKDRAQGFKTLFLERFSKQS